VKERKLPIRLTNQISPTYPVNPNIKKEKEKEKKRKRAKTKHQFHIIRRIVKSLDEKLFLVHKLYSSSNAPNPTTHRNPPASSTT
jgi:hypothetical protein